MGSRAGFIPDFKTLFEIIPGLCIAFSSDLKVIAANDNYLKAIETNRNKIIGTDFFEMLEQFPSSFSSADIGNLQASLKRVTKNKAPDTVVSQKFIFENENGTRSEGYRNFSIMPVFDGTEENVIIAFFHYITDVTETIVLRKKEKELSGRQEELNNELKKLKKQLQDTGEELDAICRSVSHDLRAPIRAINGYSKVIQEDHGTTIDDEGIRLLKMMEYNSEKLGGIIDSLVTFSRMRKTEMKPSETSMNEIVEGAFIDINKVIQHTAEIKVGKLHSSCVDYGLMHLVFVHLITNAIKFSSKTKKPYIEIKSEKRNNEIIYSVSDNGVGFDMKYAGKLFGIFQRLHSTEEFEGMGMGLSLVKRALEKHNGKIWTEAATGKGATFFFSLPE